MPLHIVSGDITKIKCDCVVNPTNNYLEPTGGVDWDIQKAAGGELYRERARIGTLSTGHAVITDAFNMICKKIIHVCSPVWQNGLNGEDILLASCYTESLKLADENHLRSIAFPLIAGGVNGFPDKKAFSVAKVAIQNYISTKSDLLVYLIIYDKSEIDINEMLKIDVEKYVEANLLRCEQPIKEKCLCKAAILPDYLEEVEVEKKFSEKLMDFLIFKDMTSAECYKRANLDKKLFSKIINGSQPKKRTILALCIALRLSLDEARDLLNCAGCSLSHSFKLDLIVEYFIVNRKYDIYELNEELFDYDLPLLGSI